MKINIKKLHPLAEIPKYAKPGDACVDLVAISKIKDHGKDYIEYGTGLAVEIPDGFVGLVYPRSSLSNYDLILANHTGVVDAGYRGEIKFRFKRTKECLCREYEVGDRIGQLMIITRPQIEFEQVETLSETVRGAGGWGSSGA